VGPEGLLMENSSDTGGNRTGDLPICSAMLPRDTREGEGNGLFYFHGVVHVDLKPCVSVCLKCQNT
jgi:hypothetical protein